MFVSTHLYWLLLVNTQRLKLLHVDLVFHHIIKKSAV